MTALSFISRSICIGLVATFALNPISPAFAEGEDLITPIQTIATRFIADTEHLIALPPAPECCPLDKVLPHVRYASTVGLATVLHFYLAVPQALRLTQRWSDNYSMMILTSINLIPLSMGLCRMSEATIDCISFCVEKTCQAASSAYQYLTERHLDPEALREATRTLLARSAEVKALPAEHRRSILLVGASLGNVPLMQAVLDEQNPEEHELAALVNQLAEETCSICLDPLSETGHETFEDPRRIVVTPCGHFFHKTCIARWRRGCPNCRAQTRGLVGLDEHVQTIPSPLREEI